MPQEQDLIWVASLNGEKREAIKTGNNAAWICFCDRYLPLVGRAYGLVEATEKTRVECPDCRRNYFVVPKDKDQGVVIEIREIETPSPPHKNNSGQRS